MPEDLLIACSLGASEMTDRLAQVGAVGADALIATEREGDRHVLRFRDDEETRKRIETIVAAEGECCSFLDFDLAERDGELILSIAAPEPGRPIADELVAAFAGSGGRS